MSDEADAKESGPMERRMAAAKADPAAMVHEALEILKHPDIPPEHLEQHLKPLLLIKHFTLRGIPIPDHLKD